MTRHKLGDKWIDVSFNEEDLEEIKSHTPGETAPHLYRTTPDKYQRTGDAQRGWVIEGITGDIINLVFYIIFLEFGTVKMAGFFMVQRSLAGMIKRLHERIAEQIGEGAPLFKLPEIVIQI